MYNEIATDHFMHPRGVGVIEDADLVGQSGAPGQGHWLTPYLKLDGERIVDAKYQTYGCPAVIAGGSMLVESIVGMSITEARAITADELTARLGGLPLGMDYAPGVAVGALVNARQDVCGCVKREHHASNVISLPALGN